MVKYLVVGDAHFSKTNKNDTDILIEEVDRVIGETKPDKLVLLGDVCDRYALRAMNRVNRWLLHLTEQLPVILVVGNHERENNTDFHTDVHNFVGMERENLQIISSAQRIDDCVFVPYVRKGMFQTSLNSVKNLKNVKYIFAHQSFVGCGEPDALDEWKSPTRIISGHIHYRHSLSMGTRIEPLSPGWNVHYIGASTCGTFADTEDRYLCIVEDDVQEIRINSNKRNTVEFSANFTSETIEQVSVSTVYTRIIIKGTLSECNAIRSSDCITEAEKRGSLVLMRPYDKDEVEGQERDQDKPFTTSVLSSMSKKWTREELDYVAQIMDRH